MSWAKSDTWVLHLFMKALNLFWHFCRPMACGRACRTGLARSRSAAGNKPNWRNWSSISLHQLKDVTLRSLITLAKQDAVRQGFFSGPLSAWIAWPASRYRGCKQREIGTANRSITEYWKDQGSGSGAAKDNMEKPFSSNNLVLMTKVITRWKMAQGECILVAMIAVWIGTGSYFTHPARLP